MLFTDDANIFEKVPTPFAGRPGRPAMKERSTFCAASEAILDGSVRKTPRKNGSSTSVKSLGNRELSSPKDFSAFAWEFK